METKIVKIVKITRKELLKKVGLPETTEINVRGYDGCVKLATDFEFEVTIDGGTEEIPF